MADADTPLEMQLQTRMTTSGRTLGTAESCTGGLITHRLTDVPGSSGYLLGGIVAYSNPLKQALLGVQEATLIQYGAVSKTTAAEMAQGARQVLGVDYAVSVTGIAGPGGGTAEKPVGLTYIGLAGPDGLLKVERYVWQGDRAANKAASVDAALSLVLENLDA